MSENELPSFSDFSSKIGMALSYKFYPKGKLIFHKGDVGKYMYIVLSGLVSIHVPRLPENLDQEKVKTASIIEKEYQIFSKKIDTDNFLALKKITNSAHLILEKDNLLTQKLKNMILNLHLFPFLKEYDLLTLGIGKLSHYYDSVSNTFAYFLLAMKESGSIFGETALFNDRPRTATCIAAQDTHLALLKKEDFKQIFSSIMVEEQRIMKLFREIFPNIAQDSLEKIKHGFKKRYFIRNDKLFHEGQPIKEIFILINGEVELSRMVKEEDININLIKKQSNEDALPMKETVKKIKQSVCVVSGLQFIGEEELVLNKKIRDYTATCIGLRIETLVCTAKDFNSVKGLCGDIMAIINEKLKQKLYTRNDRIIKDLPILKNNFQPLFLSQVNSHYTQTMQLLKKRIDLKPEEAKIVEKTCENFRGISNSLSTQIGEKILEKLNENKQIRSAQMLQSQANLLRYFKVMDIPEIPKNNNVRQKRINNYLKTLQENPPEVLKNLPQAPNKKNRSSIIRTKTIGNSPKHWLNSNKTGDSVSFSNNTKGPAGFSESFVVKTIGGSPKSQITNTGFFNTNTNTNNNSNIYIDFNLKTSQSKTRSLNKFHKHAYSSTNLTNGYQKTNEHKVEEKKKDNARELKKENSNSIILFDYLKLSQHQENINFEKNIANLKLIEKTSKFGSLDFCFSKIFPYSVQDPRIEINKNVKKIEKSPIIRSKHNLFRVKSKKEFLNEQYYDTGTFTERSMALTNYQ